MIGHLEKENMKKKSQGYQPEIKRIMLAAMLGSVSACVQLLIFNLLRNMLWPELASLIAIECAIINNFLLNNRFTFASHSGAAESRSGFAQFCKFNAVACGSLLIQLLVLSLGLHIWGRGLLLENALVILGMALGFISNYIGYRLFVWR